jgi:hypothetical protein
MIYPEHWFGPHHRRVMAVIEAVAADAFLATPPPASNPGVQSVTKPMRSEDTLVEAEPGLLLDWLDLLERQRRIYISPARPVTSDASRNVIETRLEEPVDEIERRLKAHLQPWRRESRLEQLASALVTDVLHYAAFADEPDPFWERVWQALSDGGIPVGWNGTWPEGQLLAFWPNVER